MHTAWQLVPAGSEQVPLRSRSPCAGPLDGGAYVVDPPGAVSPQGGVFLKPSVLWIDPRRQEDCRAVCKRAGLVAVTGGPFPAGQPDLGLSLCAARYGTSGAVTSYEGERSGAGGSRAEQGWAGLGSLQARQHRFLWLQSITAPGASGCSFKSGRCPAALALQAPISPPQPAVRGASPPRATTPPAATTAAAACPSRAVANGARLQRSSGSALAAAPPVPAAGYPSCCPGVLHGTPCWSLLQHAGAVLCYAVCHCMRSAVQGRPGLRLHGRVWPRFRARAIHLPPLRAGQQLCAWEVPGVTSASRGLITMQTIARRGVVWRGRRRFGRLELLASPAPSRPRPCPPPPPGCSSSSAGSSLATAGCPAVPSVHRMGPQGGTFTSTACACAAHSSTPATGWACRPARHL